MQNSKLIDLLKTFEKEDWRWFRKFLLSPYFNSREELVVFCDYLRTQAPDFKGKAIRKEKIFKKLYPGEIYDEKRISYTMNFLMGQAEQFLVQREIEKYPPLVNNYLLNVFSNRQLDKHYKYQFEKSSTDLDKYQFISDDYYYFKYQRIDIGHAYFMKQNLRRPDEQLQSAYNHLNQFYFLKVIKYSCEMETRRKQYGVDYQFYFLNEVISFFKKKEELEPISLIYLQIYLSLSEGDSDQYFIKFKELLERFEDSLPFSEKGMIYGYAINYCVLQMSKRINLIYHAEQCLELYLNGIDKGFLLSNGNLTPWTFKNIVKLGLNLRKYDFTEDFIQKYHKKLEEEYQEDALHFNLADINYRKKNYQEAQIHLIQVQFSDIFYNLGAKAMLLKIYYEINEGEALFALIASFSIYLRRNKKISKDKREAYLNFTNILGRIVRATKYKRPAIIEKINETKRLYNRNWLLEICQAR